ncbi:MAG TPA: acyl-CoA reductase, partial [Allosphingosinicella sp.]
MIDTLFSTNPAPRWPDELERIAAIARRAPFDPRAIAFVAELSGRILQSPVGREFPELAALAHWFRPASLQRMRDDQRASAGTQSLRPRGSVFIIAPANVDVLFIYGWMLSLLAGNATAARVSQKPSAARDAFLGLVRELADRHRDVLEDSLLISYPHDHKTTALLSGWCDLRLIWGGDNTVTAIRSIALKPTAIEGAFADRFSMAAFDAGSMAGADEGALTELARRFANDTMWFGQQACSSPRVVFWLGSDRQVAAAQDRFWPLFAQAAQRFEDEPAAMMARVTDLFAMAAEGVIDHAEGDYSQLPARGRGVGPSGAV